ncbi:MAG: LysR substrate-binding domain-containing protein, partial [Pseudomonadota bacterium]
QAVDELGDLARMSQERLTGALRVGVIPTIGPYLLPQIIALLGRTHPGLDLRLRETLTQRLIAELHDRRLDAAIVALPVSEPTLVEVPLLTERFVFAHPPNDDGRPTPTAEELREMRLLLLEEGHCFREQALSFCDATTGPPREILDASSLSTLMQMVSAGFGVTLLPEMAIAIETRAAPVAISHFPPPEPSRAVGMIWRKSNPLGPQLKQIAETIKADLSPP